MVDQETLRRVVEFHGHMCPGLAMGIRAAEVGLAEVGHNGVGQEVVAVVETDMCAVDAIQFMTGCTFGKGNLVHRDHGKAAFSFIRRSDGRAVRVSAKPGGWGQRDAERESLLAKMRSGTATPEESARFFALMKEGSERILSAPVEQLYDVREIDAAPPPPARILASIDCAACGEATMETRIRRLDGQELCPPCFEEAMSGATPVPLSSRP